MSMNFHIRRLGKVRHYLNKRKYFKVLTLIYKALHGKNCPDYDGQKTDDRVMALALLTQSSRAKN